MNKHGWTYMKLGEIAIVAAGQGAPQGDSNYCNSGTPFIKAGNLEELVKGNSEFSIQQVTEEVAQRHRLKLFEAGSILFAKSGMSCMKGWVYELKNNCYVVSHLAVVSPKGINPTFLLYYLQVNKPNSLVKDAAYPSISLKDIENMCVPVPSTDKQEAIVAELDEINEAIEAMRQQIVDLNNLAQSTFYSMFGDPVTNEKGWEIKKLGSLADFKNGLNFGKSESYETIRFLGVSDFQNNYYISSEDLSDVPIDHKVPQEFLLNTNDIVFVRSNGSKKLIGRSVMIQTNEPTTFSGFCIRCRLFDNNILPLFLLFVAKNNSIVEYLTNSGRGCNISNINQKILTSTPIILPPLALQQQFAARVEAIEAAKAELNAQIAEMQTLLASRMDYYFD